MRSLFTIHAGELLVGDHLERNFRNLHLWLPSQDTGTDLLVTDFENKKAVSFQIKYSRDFLATHLPAVFQKPLRVCGWWTLKRSKIKDSKADYWVFVVMGFEHRTTDFVIIKPADLLLRLDAIHGRMKTFQSYLWVTEKGRCWESRGLTRRDQLLIAQGGFKNEDRDFTSFLNNWKPIRELDR